MKKIKMVQTSNNRWRLESESGVILLDDIVVHSLYEAEEFAKAYISSYSCWTFELIAIKDKLV